MEMSEVSRCGLLCRPAISCSRQMHRLYVAAHGFRAVGHRAVHPHADLHRRAAGDIATKVRRDLYCHRQLAIAHPAVQFVIAVQRRLLDKVA